MNERVTVNFDEESYYLDGEYWESWDSYGEEMADAINILLDKQNTEIKRLKKEKYDLQSMIIDIFDFIKKKGTVTREEFEKWWKW